MLSDTGSIDCDELTLIIAALEVTGGRVAGLESFGAATGTVAADVVSAGARCAWLRNARAMGTSEMSTSAAVPAAHKSLRCHGRFHQADLELKILAIVVGKSRDASFIEARKVFTAAAAHT